MKEAELFPLDVNHTLKIKGLLFWKNWELKYPLCGALSYFETSVSPQLPPLLAAFAFPNITLYCRAPGKCRY